jgi:hypothetical protein
MCGCLNLPQRALLRCPELTPPAYSQGEPISGVAIALALLASMGGMLNV